MQECPYCGQQNSDFEDRCVYCGELLFIEVEHDEEKNSFDDIKNDINHQYAAKIARELLEEEQKKQKLKSYDDFDDFTKDLLDPMDISREITPEKEDYEDKSSDDKTTYTENMFEETLSDLTDDYIEEDNSEYTIYNDDINDNTYEDNTNDYEIENNIPSEDLMEIESRLKKKIKRNKKLETRLGLSFKNIALVLNDKGSIEILGSVSTNTVYDNNCLKLSVICYDNDLNEIEQSSTLIIMNSLKTYYDFNIILNPDINKTAILILMPEIVDKLPDKKIINNANKKVQPKKVKHPQQNKVNVAEKSSNSIFIEQMKDIERRIGMNIDNTSILIKSKRYLEIVGEIYIKHPDKYNNIKIAATCYDKNNKIIATESTHINTKLYLGFDTLSLKLKDVDVSRVERIKLYPTLQ